MTVRASILNHMKRQKAFTSEGVTTGRCGGSSSGRICSDKEAEKATAEELGIGEITLRDIVKRLGKACARPA